MSPEAPTPDHAPRVTLYGREACHLCDDAREIIAAVCAELGESFIEIDIDTDPDLSPELAHRFSDEVPVTYVDGRQHDFWRVDAARLRAALTAS